MSKEKYLEELSDELRISKPMLKKYIHAVGTNKENIKDYAKNGSCAIVRKDNGFDVSYVAQMLNEKDAKIKELEHRLSNCIELPQGIDVGNTVYYVTEYCNEEGDELYEIEVGLVHWIEKALRVSNVEFNDNGNLKETYDGFNYTIYVRYESGLTFQHSFEDVGVWLFATEEEAKAMLEELKNANN